MAGTARQFTTSLAGASGFALLGGFTGILIVAPLATILYRAFVHVAPGSITPTFEHLATVLSGAIYWLALWNTLIVAGGAAVVAASLGALFAWIFVRTDTPLRGILERAAELPIFIPPFVGAVAWILLAAPRIGLFNRALMRLDIGWQFDVSTLTGMLCVIGIYLVPYVMLIVAAALRGMDPSLEEAAQISGFGIVAANLRITFPLLAPAFVSGLVLAFTIAIGLFGTPIVLGWSHQTLLLTSRIWISAQAVPPQYGLMAVLCFYLIGMASIAAALQRRILAGRSYVTITGKGFRPRLIELGAWRWLTFAMAVLYLLLTVLAPILVLTAAAMSTYTWSGVMSVGNLLHNLSSEDVWLTMRTSLVISLLSATVATLAGTGIAWVVVRSRLPLRSFIEHLVLLPIAVPGIAFGVGVMLFWVGVSLPVYGTMLIILFAFVGRFTAYAVRSISASLVQVHPELEESARVSGLGPLGAFVRITIPLVLPGIIAGWLLLFSFFITELSIVILLYTASTRTFSVLSFEVWNVGNFSRLASLSLLQLLIGLLIASGLRLLLGARLVQEPT
ncbi:MAG: iron ABC transporter permease [Acidisphaera sp.]|nr:iron ABC transporter permease [Acidisphaera sp.]